jgi:hypothetical protein
MNPGFYRDKVSFEKSTLGPNNQKQLFVSHLFALSNSCPMDAVLVLVVTLKARISIGTKYSQSHHGRSLYSVHGPLARGSAYRMLDIL